MKHKRKKICRMRGTKTHGWGSMKKHRGSGNRGGFGMAGTGKRADQRKPSIIKEYGESYFGKKGFKKAIKMYRPISIKYLTKNLQKLVEEGKIKKEGEGCTLDLTKLGYQKLLSNGEPPSFKITIFVESASKKAREKIEQGGGRVILTNKETQTERREEKDKAKREQKQGEENELSSESA